MKNLAFLLVFAIAVALGWGLHVLYGQIFYPQKESYIEQLDLNEDGSFDEVYVYIDGRLDRIEADRNFDGVVDSVHYFKGTSAPYETRLDDNFNGIFESVFLYQFGQPHEYHADIDEDGEIDHLGYYVDGVLEKIKILDDSTNTTVRIDYYSLNKVRRSHIDKDRDGVLESKEDYDFWGLKL